MNNHVLENRKLYRQKFTAVLRILDDVLEVQKPDAAFYLWPKTPIDDKEFTRGLFSSHNVTVLPGSFLSREANGINPNGVNPGQNHVRMALVASLDECVEAANRIKEYVKTL